MRTCENLSVKLDPPSSAGHVHTNGDKISGQVRLSGTHSLKIDRISIFFKGKTKSRVEVGGGDSRRIHVAKGLLFHFRKDLVLSCIPAQSPSFWSFEFVIPWESRPTLQPGPFGPHEDFEHEPGFPLPPTFVSEENGPSQSIYYYLETVAHDSGATFFTEKKARHYINFSPSRPTLTPLSPCTFEKTTVLNRCTKKLAPELIALEQQLSISQKARRMISRSEPKPISYFSIWSRIPYQGKVAGPFPISLGVIHDSARSTAPQIPEVTLKNINARFTAYTRARVPYKTFSDPGLRHNYCDTRGHKVYFLNRDVSIPMYERMELSDLLVNMTIPKDLAPCFRTYNISRYYHLKVTADLACVGEDYRITMSREYGSLAFSLMPRLSQARLDSLQDGNEQEEHQRVEEGLRATERSLPIDDEDVEWLPTYEEVEGQGPSIVPR